MIDTTFETCSLDRKLIHWEDHIHDLSPVEQHGGLFFKREDFFAPLGYGNINGSKLRVCEKVRTTHQGALPLNVLIDEQ